MSVAVVAPPIGLVVFDCDGVLVDSERISNQVLADLLAECGLLLTLAETIDAFMGKSMPQTIEIATRLLGASLPREFPVRLAARTRDAFRSDLQVVPGVPGVLDALPVPCCVASNGDRAKMRASLSRTGLLARFEGRMFSAEDVMRPKPAPDLFLLAAQSLGFAPGECLVVEDTPTGIAAAKAAGMAVYAYAGLAPIEKLRAAGPNGIIHRMQDLLSVLGPADALRIPPAADA